MSTLKFDVYYAQIYTYIHKSLDLTPIYIQTYMYNKFVEDSGFLMSVTYYTQYLAE